MIFTQRYVTTAGPIVTSVNENGANNASGREVHNGDRLISTVYALNVCFSEVGNATLAASASNTSNWRLMRYGVDVSSQITIVQLAYDGATNTSIATVYFSQPLEGQYQLVALPSIQDLANRGLDGDADHIIGGAYRLTFSVGPTYSTGPEVQVNTYTTNDQQYAKVATDAAGNYVVVWQSNLQDGGGYGIYAQRYTANGFAAGGEFRVNTFTIGDDEIPSIAMDAAGDFVIAWQATNSDGSGWGVVAQQYRANGTAVGAEFVVNTYSTSDQTRPSVAMDAAGDFVIAYQSGGQDGSLYGIYATRFNPAGAVQGNEFRVNTYTTGDQNNCSVAMDSTGDFVVTWQSKYQLGAQNISVFAQRYNAGGLPIGGEFTVNSDTVHDAIGPSVGMDASGDFVIAWSNYGATGPNGGNEVWAKRYGADSTPGVEFQVNTYTTNTQGAPSVSMDAAGEFVIDWASYGQDGSKFGIYARKFNSALQYVQSTPEFLVNTFTTDNQASASVAMDASGDVVFAWMSANQDGNGYGIYKQKLTSDITPQLTNLEPTPLLAVGALNTPVTSSLIAINQNSLYHQPRYVSATVQIATNYVQIQDVLKFTNQLGITGSWNDATGTMTLSGYVPITDYQTALRSVTYLNTSGSPNTALTRTIDIQVNDGFLSSNVVSRDIKVTGNSILSGTGPALNYVENATPLQFVSSLSIADPGVGNPTKATVTMTNWQPEDRLLFNNLFAFQHRESIVGTTDTYTITKNDTIDHYQAMLRSFVYWDVSDNPNALAQRLATVRLFFAGGTSSNSVSQTIGVTAVNDQPFLSAIESTSLAYKANDPAFPAQPISATLLIADPDSNNLIKATVQITSGYQNDVNGKDLLSFTSMLGIAGSFNPATGMMTLTGTSGVGNYRTAIRSIAFSSSGSNVSTANRTLTINATDDSGSPTALSASITRIVTVSTTNIPPGLTGIPNSPVAYVRGAAAVPVSPNAFVFDPDSINLMSATVQITGNYQNGNDVLTATGGSGITSAFNTSNGTLTLSGISSVANYQTALRSLTYKTNAAANASLRTLTFILNDGLATSSRVTGSVTLT